MSEPNNELYYCFDVEAILHRLTRCRTHHQLFTGFTQNHKNMCNIGAYFIPLQQLMELYKTIPEDPILFTKAPKFNITAGW